ncbi:hypothetical protein PoB_007195800 [Plakobranchus ocellatus]|uniref:Uncharacterized protein n=1 Tax=Plakobranchus ocellatus TaxID=259542 RepID=A0AAV4DMA6_9GAST|nr:hypothetical protein PoB_007195800 [Plakobranchus ocellatus]
MAPSFPLSNRTTDVRPGCKTQKIAPTLRQDRSRCRLSVCPHHTRPVCCYANYQAKHWPTQEAAAHVSNNRCFEILSFFGASAHQVGYLSKRRSYPLCFTAWSYVSGSVDKGKRDGIT